MSMLSDRLKSLGVQVGAKNLPPPPLPDPDSLQMQLAGSPLPTPFGETYRVERYYSAGYRHGRVGLSAWDAPLQPSAGRETVQPLRGMAAWAGLPALIDLPLESFAFLDTETTGLMGGTGTYAFLIGVGRVETGQFHLEQFFLRDPVEEPAQLAALEAFLAPCQALVTFNGKSFDMPLLKTRFIVHGLTPSFQDLVHLDLLHLARRLWRDRLPSRTLGSLEYQILGSSRSEEDIPGWMIPELYFDYLATGDARPLKRIFYHNEIDVVSLAALFNYCAALLADPLGGAVEHGVDLIAIAKLYEDLDDLDMATRLYVHGLEHDLPRASLLEALQRLAGIYKGRSQMEAALHVWQEGARHGHIQAHIELAKFYEHHARAYEQAIFWTQQALDLVQSAGFPADERATWLPELEHRLARLQRKDQGRSAPSASS